MARAKELKHKPEWTDEELSGWARQDQGYDSPWVVVSRGRKRQTWQDYYEEDRGDD